MTVKEQIDARKVKFQKDDLEELFDGASKVIGVRGKKSTVFNMKKDPPELDDLAKAVLGPSGGLRAPAIRMGKTWVVGFGQPGWDEIFD